MNANARETTETVGPLGQRENERPELASPYDAIKYVLDRIQTDPDLRHHMLHTQAMALLCAAEACEKGRRWIDVLNDRVKDLQPEHSRRLPDLVVARDRIEELERDLRNKELDLLNVELERPAPKPAKPELAEVGFDQQWWER